MAHRKDRWLEEFFSSKDRRKKFSLLITIGFIWSEIALVIGVIILILRALGKI